MEKGVLIYAEMQEGKLVPVTGELLGAGKKLADALGEELSAILIGSDVSSSASEVIALGAQKVYVVDDPLLKDYLTDSHVMAMEQALRQIQPQILLMGQTEIGRDLAPRLAFRLKTGVSTDCTELSIDAETKFLLQSRPVYGGNARAVFSSPTKPQIATVRAKAMEPLAKDPSRQGETVALKVELETAKIRARVLKRVKEEVAGVKLEEASVVVGGGRGINGSEGFQQLEALAGLFKGAVGASRPPIDNNWLPSSQQIGLTGKIIAPELYISVAISGSSQHMAGCSGAKTIVAINKDPEANIFKEARFGVVGDWKQVLPAFTEKVKELLG
ncbi:electron transfer flavoprotein subunit alpha/FixB family protein [Chloroflexota bacterium]